MLIRLALAGLFSVALVTPQALPRGSASTSSLSEQLDQYDRGDFDGAIRSTLTGNVKLADVRQAIQRDAPAWITRLGPYQTGRRRLLVAAFALDVARGVYAWLQSTLELGPFQNPGQHGRYDDLQSAWVDLRPLIEWACTLLRDQPTPVALEREWFLASVQLFRDFDDPDVRPARNSGVAEQYGLMPGHLGHAFDRFPEEPWFRVMSAERQTNFLAGAIRDRWEMAESDFSRLVRPGVHTSGMSRSSPAVSETWGKWAYLADLQRARTDLLPLVSNPSVKGRVNLCLGGIALCFAQHNEARRYFDDVAAWTSNPCLTYLARFLRARVDEMDGRKEDAEGGYRDALAIVPRAQSGSTALAALLWLRDRPTEATTLVNQGLTRPLADDPWTAWQNGGQCTEWYQFIGKLRAGLR